MKLVHGEGSHHGHDVVYEDCPTCTAIRAEAALKEAAKWRPVVERLVEVYGMLTTGTWPPGAHKWEEVKHAVHDARGLLDA